MTEEKKEKKCFLSAIWEAITKKGGCCGSGEEVCGSSEPEKKEEPCCQDKEDKKDGPCCTS